MRRPSSDPAIVEPGEAGTLLPPFDATPSTLYVTSSRMSSMLGALALDGDELAWRWRIDRPRGRAFLVGEDVVHVHERELLVRDHRSPRKIRT